MKQILLPTDFSSISNNAAKYALEMFGNEVYEREVEFTLFHAHLYVSPTMSSGMIPATSSEKLMESKKLSLDSQLEELRSAYPNQTIKAELTTGSVVSEISSYVEKESIDLVVLGSHPKSGIDRWVEGLNAYDISKDTACPVLVIPEDVRFTLLKKILFATDFRNLHDLSILESLRDVVKTHETEFMMLHIYAEKETSSDDKHKMNEALNKFFHSDRYRHYFLEHDDPVEGIEEFVTGYQADLLALVAQERGFLKSLFHKSVTKQMIIHSRLPLFILNATIKVPVTEKKKSVQERMREQVKDWKGDIDALYVQLHLGKKEAKDELDEKRQNAREKLHKLKERLNEVGEVSEDKWENFRKEMSDALGHMKKAFVGKK